MRTLEPNILVPRSFTVSLRHLCASVLMAAMLTTATAAIAAQSETDRQAASVLEARKKSSNEVKAILARLSERQKDDLVRQQAIIDGVLQANPDGSISPDERQRLWNATKVIDSIIEGEKTIADGRLVCRQERAIGSQLAKRKCRTKAELDRETEDGRRDLDDMQRGRK